jgi:large subunit ribosomal protein L10
MNRQSKEQIVSELAQTLSTAKAAFIADYRGINVDQANDLRGRLRQAGCEYRVVKNTLLKLAAKDTPAECLAEFMVGPTAIAIAPADPVAPAKALDEFCKAVNKFELKGAMLDGKALQIAQVKDLANLPSREELLAKMLGSINAPVSNFVGVLAAVPRSLVQVLGAIRDQKEAA